MARDGAGTRLPASRYRTNATGIAPPITPASAGFQVPSAKPAEIEETQHHRRVHHAGDRQSKAEQQAAGQCAQDLHPANRLTATTSTATAMNVAVAASDRGDSRASPHTPWPLVHPFASRVPTPTSNPAAISNKPDPGR